MNVGAHLVDMSPLSTTGAMCLAGIADPAQVRPTYNKLLAWGMSMTVIGALLVLDGVLTTPRGQRQRAKDQRLDATALSLDECSSLGLLALSPLVF